MIGTKSTGQGGQLPETPRFPSGCCQYNKYIIIRDFTFSSARNIEYGIWCQFYFTEKQKQILLGKNKFFCFCFFFSFRKLFRVYNI